MRSVVPFASTIVGSSLTLDFLRLTVPIDDGVTEWLRPIRHHQDLEKMGGHKTYAYQLSDMQGVMVGRAAWAKSKTHALAEIRGGLTEEVYPFYTEKKGKATRIDIALTIWLESYDHAIAEWCHKHSTTHMVESGLAERRRMPIIFGGLDGWTCYLGSRKSDRFFRIYDKDKQSGESAFKNAWRFEIECKGKVAQNLWERLRDPLSRPYVMQGEVISYLESYGIVLKGFVAQFGPTKTGSASQPADVKRKLEWLQSQVRPTVTDLIERGFAPEVYYSLDIPYQDLRNTE